MVERKVSVGEKIRRGIITATYAAGMLSARSPQISTVCQNESESPQCNNSEVWDGYWWRDEVWVPSYPSIDTWFRPAPDWSKGGAVFYSDGVMEANAEYRDISLEGYKGGVALMSPADIGLPVWMRKNGEDWEGPFMVVDSATRGDIFPIINYRNEVVEVSYQQAEKWGMVNSKGEVLEWRLDDVEVSKLPPDHLSGEPVDYQKWWLDNYQPSGKERVWNTPAYRSPSTWKIHGNWVTFNSPILSIYPPSDFRINNILKK